MGYNPRGITEPHEPITIGCNLKYLNFSLESEDEKKQDFSNVIGVGGGDD